MNITLDKLFAFVCAAFCAILLLASCTAPVMPPVRQVVLGTVCTVNAFEDGNQKIYDEIFARLNDIETKMSAKIDNSEIALINKQAGIAPAVVSDETFSIIDAAAQLAQASGGAFDPTIGPVVQLWDIGGSNERVPLQSEIDNALTLVNYRDIVLNKENKSVFLRNKGMKIDLGGIAKGYAADETAAILKQHGVRRALIDLGGNIYAYGSKTNSIPWTLGIKNPTGADASAVLSIPAENISLVTSGLYERFFMSGGKRYHHIIDPKTGYPVENDVLSFSILSESSMTADALSTACFILGPTEGMALLERMKNAQGIVICTDLSVSASKSIAQRITILNTSFSLR